MKRLARTPSGPFDILLVEDDPDHAELIARSFADQPMGHRVHHLTDGEAALDYLFRRGAYEASSKPHVIILDLRLPKLDGLEVLKKIRSTKEFHSIPVIVLTTSRAESDVATAYQHRANSYLIKPLSTEDFRSMVVELGRYWLGWNHWAPRTS